MRYLVDSDVLADYLNGISAADEMLAGIYLDGLAISVITYGEIQEGILFGDDRASHQENLRTFLEEVPVLPVTMEIALRFAVIKGILRRAGQGIGPMDTLIAATALEHDLTLVSRNLRHFARVPDLSLWPAGS